MRLRRVVPRILAYVIAAVLFLLIVPTAAGSRTTAHTGQIGARVEL